MNPHEWFETKKRTSGESFVALKYDAPQWLLNAVRGAHQGSMPNDWIFAECEAACITFSAGTSSDDTFDYCDARVDVYTKNLFSWATEMCLTDTWSSAEEEADELGYSEDDGIVDRIRKIQFSAIRYIAEVMIQACEDATKLEEES
jgi:hypothetical protein